MHDQPWTTAPLVALDLEGTGSQDRHDEAILEIAVVPLVEGRPDMSAAWDSLINPERRISPRPWISPHLTASSLADAPILDKVSKVITEKLSGKIIVGHNVGVDWRLIHLRLPHIEPAGLLDTARLVRHLRPDIKRWSLTTLLAQYDLQQQVTTLVPGAGPHSARWDAVGAALLLAELVGHLPAKADTTLDRLAHVAGLEFRDQAGGQDDQLTLDL